MDELIFWATHAPIWQVYLVMLLSLIMLILMTVPKLARKHLWVKGTIAAQKLHLDSAKTVTDASEEIENHAIVAKNAKGEITQSTSDKTSQDANGIKTDCSASPTSAASVISQS